MNPLQPSILIADDDRDLRETLGDIFEPLGLRTLLAGDGEEALGIVRRESIDLLLLDMHMPRLSGLETVHQLRAENHRLPCILMSARLDDAIRHQAELEQVYSILSKPVTRRDLTTSVEAALRQTYGWE